jgi:hypothetical protein
MRDLHTTKDKLKNNWFYNNVERYTYFATRTDKEELNGWEDLERSEMIYTTWGGEELKTTAMWAIEYRKNIYKNGKMFWRNPWIR